MPEEHDDAAVETAARELMAKFGGNGTVDAFEMAEAAGMAGSSAEANFWYHVADKINEIVLQGKV